MDLSLDDYFQSKVVKNKGNKPSGILSRLGPKTSPARNRKQNATQFKVTGVGNVKGAQQQKKVKTISVNDARIKLNQGKMFQSRDLRTKVNNLKARNTDARERIRSRQGNKAGGGGGATEPQVIVTGLGQPYKGLVNRSGVTNVGGMLTKTVKTTPQANQRGQKQGLSRTIKGPGAFKGKGGGAISVRVTPRNEKQQQAAEQPKVRVMNEHYVPPAQPQPQRQAPVIQPAQYTNYEYTPHVAVPQPYIEPQPSMSIMEPVLQQVMQPSYQPSYTTTHAMKTFSEPDKGTSGYRVLVTNLHPIVTQDDLVELFGSIGALKKARLVKAGMAEIVYMTRDDALSACKKYHMRELDGQPMQVNMTSLSTLATSPQQSRQAPVRSPSPIVFSAPPRREKASKKPAKSPSPISVDDEEEESAQPLKLGQKPGPGPLNMDMNLVNKALFKTRIAGTAPRPVTFTVKI